MAEGQILEIDKLIKELEDEESNLQLFDLPKIGINPEALMEDPSVLEYIKRHEARQIWVRDKILELKKERAILSDKGMAHEETDRLQTMKLGDIVIIPGTCITIGNYAMSDYATYDSMRTLFEKGTELYITKEMPRPKSGLLHGGQFSSGLKFLYAMVKYVSSKHIKKENNLYELHTDDDFASYFKEAGKFFDFISKTNTEIKGGDLDFWKGPRNYCNKILKRCSENISIDHKEGGKKELWFYVREE